MKPLNVNQVKKLSYTDFVGLVNQSNVLPGAYSTLNKWVQFSDLNSHSKVLELACTTGFSSREVATMTGCSVIGIDISEQSVNSAKLNQKKYAPHIKSHYETVDGYRYTPKSKFTHIIVGASLGFFPDPKKMIERCTQELLTDGGFLLASPFYTVKKIPLALIKKAKKVFGINITTSSYKEIMSLYNKFEVLFEERNLLILETKEEIEYYAHCTTERAVRDLKIKDKNTERAIFERLVEIKNMSNILRPYQGYSVLVLRYRAEIYPNRFVELF